MALIKAKELLKKYKEKCVGLKIWTFPMGDWPGGEGVIIKMIKDEEYPDIIFQIDTEKNGDIGVFKHEWILLLTEENEGDNMEIQCLNCGNKYNVDDYDNCPSCGYDNEELINDMDNEDE